MQYKPKILRVWLDILMDNLFSFLPNESRISLCIRRRKEFWLQCQSLNWIVSRIPHCFDWLCSPINWWRKCYRLISVSNNKCSCLVSICTICLHMITSDRHILFIKLRFPVRTYYTCICSTLNWILFSFFISRTYTRREKKETPKIGNCT